MRRLRQRHVARSLGFVEQQLIAEVLRQALLIRAVGELQVRCAASTALGKLPTSA